MSGPAPAPADDPLEAACRKAEKSIQRILLDLEEEHATRVESVQVDTRNFADCAVEVFLHPTRPRDGKV